MDNLNTLILILLLAETSYLIYKIGVKNETKSEKKPIFIDTSVLIDGRIISVAKSGLISSAVFVPRSVLGELQLLADGGDTDKRLRARHGLDVLAELQQIQNLEVNIYQDSNTASEGVDNRLIALAKRHNGSICTIDYNLAKVALVERVSVINLNDLAMTLRMAYLPGEKTMLELTQAGQEKNQAIGHLSDGTMVVVENAASLVGKVVEVEFIRSLQTAAGKMMFAKLTNQERKPYPIKNNSSQTSKTHQNNKSYHKKPNQKPNRQANSKSGSDKEHSLINLINNQ